MMVVVEEECCGLFMAPKLSISICQHSLGHDQSRA